MNKAKEYGVPIRIGVNGGSLEKSILEKYGHPTPEALVESAMYHIALLERFDFTDIQTYTTHKQKDKKRKSSQAKYLSQRNFAKYL